MKRVLIIGSNGGGKSTFSRLLASATGLPVYHLDQLYWYGDWQVRPHEAFLEDVLTIAKTDAWIIEGNNLRSLEQRLQYADTVFWLEMPPLLCVWNVIRRELRYRGTARPDMPQSCISRIDVSFLKTVWQFNRKNRKKIRQLLSACSSIGMIRFTAYRQLRDYLSDLPKNDGSM